MCTFERQGNAEKTDQRVTFVPFLPTFDYKNKPNQLIFDI